MPRTPRIRGCGGGGRGRGGSPGGAAVDAQLDEDDELAEDMLEVEEEVDLADSPEPDTPGDFDEEL